MLSRASLASLAARTCACAAGYCVSFARALAACGDLARVSARPQLGSHRQLSCRASYIACPKNCTHCSKVMAQKLREWTYGQAAVHRVFTPMLRPKLPRRGEMIEFLAQMPSETMIFITMALLVWGQRC
jgi:hypothetical protein